MKLNEAFENLRHDSHSLKWVFNMNFSCQQIIFLLPIIFLHRKKGRKIGRLVRFYYDPATIRKWIRKWMKEREKKVSRRLWLSTLDDQIETTSTRHTTFCIFCCCCATLVGWWWMIKARKSWFFSIELRKKRKAANKQWRGEKWARNRQYSMLVLVSVSFSTKSCKSRHVNKSYLIWVIWLLSVGQSTNDFELFSFTIFSKSKVHSLPNPTQKMAKKRNNLWRKFSFLSWP